ncbi:MAG: hypothetical protein A2X32_08695 [Elusimicrobia bacterium GWC2_64_44]|nr:MAG: hypothetical protein A2X32_08695 [Elusimicrobia bacterium GWC2_64_44]
MKPYALIIFSAAVLAAGPAAGGGLAEAVRAMTAGTEARIQERVLDPMLGRGAAHAFLEMKAELASAETEESRSGYGEARTRLPDAANEEGGLKEQSQLARQNKASAEKKTVLGLAPGAMKLRVLHDASVPQEKLKAVREALAALFPGKLRAEDITFVPAIFARPLQ